MSVLNVFEILLAVVLIVLFFVWQSYSAERLYVKNGLSDRGNGEFVRDTVLLYETDKRNIPCSVLSHVYLFPFKYYVTFDAQDGRILTQNRFTRDESIYADSHKLTTSTFDKCVLRPVEHFDQIAQSTTSSTLQTYSFSYQYNQTDNSVTFIANNIRRTAKLPSFFVSNSTDSADQNSFLLGDNLLSRLTRVLRPSEREIIVPSPCIDVVSGDSQFGLFSCTYSQYYAYHLGGLKNAPSNIASNVIPQFYWSCVLPKTVNDLRDIVEPSYPIGEAVPILNSCNPGMWFDGLTCVKNGS